jgi:CIC family chloride channel protein
MARPLTDAARGSPEPPGSPARGGPGAEPTGAVVESDWRLLGLAALFGIFVGFVALAFILPIHAAERWTEHWAALHPTALPWAVLVVPALGGAVCAALAILLPIGLGGHGVSMVLYAVSRLSSRLPFRIAVRQWLAATATIVSGGSAGPEGPIVTIGATLGSNAGQALRLNRDSTTTLLGAGAAAGIAAVFNAPIAGVFFALEVLLRDFSIRTFAPIVVASVLASATTQTVLGGREPLFGVDPAIFDSIRGSLGISSSPVFALLGVVCGLVAVLFVRSLRRTESAFLRSRLPKPLRPILGGLALGAMGAGYLLLPAGGGMPIDAQIPPFMGNGYGLIDRLLDPDFYATVASSLGTGQAAAVLGVWLLAKIVATSLTLGSGSSGGLFAPSLVLGALAGGGFGIFVEASGLLPFVHPTHCALVGMAGAVAATTHAPLSGILLVYELTQDYSLILPLMLTATIATIVARAIERESAYTAELAAQGIRFGTRGDASPLRRLAVGDVPLDPCPTVSIEATAESLVPLAERNATGDLAVVDAEGRYCGLVGGRSLRAALVHQSILGLLQVGELMQADAPTVTLDDPLDVALARFAAADAQCLAVLDRDGRAIGLLSRDRLMARYRDELERDA